MPPCRSYRIQSPERQQLSALHFGKRPWNSCLFALLAYSISPCSLRLCDLCVKLLVGAYPNAEGADTQGTERSTRATGYLHRSTQKTRWIAIDPPRYC